MLKIYLSTWSRSNSRMTPPVTPRSCRTLGRSHVGTARQEGDAGAQGAGELRKAIGVVVARWAVGVNEGMIDRAAGFRRGGQHAVVHA